MKPLADRFWAKVDRRGADECWPWTGARSKGYGTIWSGEPARRSLLAHRVVYELIVGEIPGGMHLDHLCRNPPCVNPSHLEVVTQTENTRRGNAGKVNREKTHCKSGHEFTPENTYIYSDTGKRRCRACARRWSATARAPRSILAS